MMDDIKISQEDLNALLTMFYTCKMGLKQNKGLAYKSCFDFFKTLDKFKNTVEYRHIKSLVLFEEENNNVNS